MDSLTQLAQLGPLLAGSVGGITPDQLDGPTPCGGQTFGPAVEPPPDATPIQRFAAYTGRRPFAPESAR